MSDQSQRYSNPDLFPDRFNFISWVLCMSGILIPATVASFLDTERDFQFAGYVFGFLLTLGYFSIPYWIYHNQVNHGEMTGCFPQLIFLLFTGVIGAVLFLWYWDLIRWIQTRIMKPSFEVKYAVNSKGMLRG